MSKQLKKRSYFRSRTKGKMTPGPNVVFSRINSSCGETAWTVTADYGPTAQGEVQSIDDYVTPRFRELQAQGQVAFSPMNMSRTRMTLVNVGQGQENERQTPAGCIGTGAKQRGKTDGPAVVYYLSPLNMPAYPTPPTIASLIDSRDKVSALEEVTTKVLADRGKGDSNLWESIFEYKQTLGMFQGGISRLWAWFIKNQNPLSKMTPQNAWLAYRYGILPFVRDVESILKGLKKPIGKRRQTTRARLEINEAKNSVVDTGNILSTYRVFLNQQTVETYEVRGMSLDEYVADVKSNVGLTTKGLLTVPWELIPYSFVVDWFLNVGDFINALAPAPGYQQLGTAMTVRSSQISKVSIVGLTVLDANFVNKRMPTGEFELLRETKSRGTLGLPSLVIKSDFRLLTATRMADSIALLLQKMGPTLAGRK